ncbi:MAG: HAD family hydrolase [Candidatus Hodarchaeota archaeon]
MKSIKAIVWDLDGTLIHFKIDYLRARHVAIKILKKYGVPKNLLTVRYSILENVSSARDFFQKEGLSRERINEIIAEVDKEIIEIEHEAAVNAVMINGIDQVLKFAKSKDLKQAIFTFNTRKNARISLEKVSLLGFFELIVGRDNISNLKPHPDHLKFICNELSVEPDEIVVIGDSDRDIEAAINVGAHSIALNTTRSNFHQLETFKKANKIVELNEIPSELIEAIEEFL